jgi:hypothetical protein
MTAYKQDEDYGVVYFCKVGKKEGFSCGFNAQSIDAMSAHILYSHPTPEQIAKVFQFLAQEGLNIEQAITVIQTGRARADYIATLDAKIAELAKERDAYKKAAEQAQAGWMEVSKKVGEVRGDAKEWGEATSEAIFREVSACARIAERYAASGQGQLRQYAGIAKEYSRPQDRKERGPRP